MPTTNNEQKGLRDYTKFFTPQHIAEFMVSLLQPRDKDAILEPSAGNGALVSAVKAVAPKSIVFAFETDVRWENYLRGITNIVVIKDFLTIPVYAKFTSCIANPPFGNETDLQAHFDAIRNHVRVGGKIVMIVPKDFTPQNILHNVFPIENWATNSDGTKTEIKIIEFINPPTEPIPSTGSVGKEIDKLIGRELVLWYQQMVGLETIIDEKEREGKKATSLIMAINDIEAIVSANCTSPSTDNGASDVRVGVSAEEIEKMFHVHFGFIYDQQEKKIKPKEITDWFFKKLKASQSGADKGEGLFTREQMEKVLIKMANQIKGKMNPTHWDKPQQRDLQNDVMALLRVQVLVSQLPNDFISSITQNK